MTKIWRYSLFMLALSVILIFAAAFSLPDDKLHLVFCNVGQGDAILIYRKTAQVLVDGGPDKSVLSCLSGHMPFWDRRIEAVILTHPDLDHYGGLVDVLRAYNVGTFAWSGVEKEDAGFKTLKTETEKEQGMEVVVMEAGDELEASGTEFISYWPRPHNSAYFRYTGISEKTLGAKESANEFSLVLELRYGAFNALLTGDIIPPAVDILAAELARRPPRGEWEILKVPHHGSKNGLTESLLEATKPQLAVISVGKNNRYGHPHAQTIKLLTQGATEVLRTDLDGEVEIVTDGKGWWRQ